MADLDIDALREVARGATDGPWGYDAWGNESSSVYVSGILRPPTGVAVAHGSSVEPTDGEPDWAWVERRFKQSRRDAEHIATFDPPTVLALLDELERLRATVARVEALAEAGVHFDMTPTMPGHGVAYAAWQGYLQRLDDAWTDRLRAAPGAPMNARLADLVATLMGLAGAALITWRWRTTHPATTSTPATQRPAPPPRPEPLPNPVVPSH
ncbi:ead/Ea22-like family protein [Nocardioides bruguierae]|uniref:ead/Ea22-like family protein n=1 Tax=Nocardioides bruguierae TaxID=2945102 RepID=UPI002020950F|nr:ead/Ea22-like family protein [Nocardioides bruguierae]MCL8026329.1 ead/Ea22-like family protein [Nocardioides bruguierae]